ncbi:PKD domain-containing protein [Planctomycetota bacterium]|nr:PKD domain-containing protein [Planctomycetota bacterium]
MPCPPILRTLICAALGLIGLAGAAPVQDPVDSAAYLLVIDHSGSMNTKTRPTRWQEMVERAVGFLEQAPLESLIWIAVFDESAKDMTVTERVLNSDDDRERLIRHLRRQRKPRGGTALYDTLAVAFDYADTLSSKTPGRYVSVMVYTDGEDRNSRMTREQIQARFGRLVDTNTNVWCFLTPLVDGLDPALEPGGNVVVGSPKRPVPVRLRPGSLQLGTPTRGPLPIELELVVRADAASTFKGPARLRWEGEFEAEISPSELELRPGPVPLRLEARDPGGLDAGKEYEGKLIVEWPKADEAILQGPSTVSVRFQPAEPPRIQSVFPKPGAVVAVGEPIDFVVETLAGAQVRWDLLGDGTALRDGARVRHTYTGKGKYTVGLTVTDPRTDLETQASVAIEAIDIGVGINPLSGPIFAGVPFRFTCTGRGGVDGFEWYVDGRKFPGMGKDGDELTYTFADPGSATLRVVANHPRARVESESVEVPIGLAPGLRLLAPQDGANLDAMREQELRVSVDGPIEAVRWTLAAADGRVIREATVPVDGSSAESTLSHAFEETDAGDVRISAEAVLSMEGATAPTATISARITPPSRRAALVRPAAGATLAAEEPASFEVELEGPGFVAVEWSARWEGSSDAALTGRSDVEDGGRATWSPTIPGAAGVLLVEARTVLESGASAPVANRSWTVTYPEVKASLRIEGGDRFDDPVRFVLTGEGLTGATWTFGDGNEETTSALENQHTYGAYGRFTARIEVRGAGGKRRSIERLIDIPFDAPVAAALMRVEGDESSSFAPDQVIDLVNASSGHYVNALWTIDGVPLEADRDTLLFDDAGRGDHVLGLTVTGPRAADGGPPVQDRVEIPFRVVRYDHALFGLGTALLMAVLGILGRLLWGNAPARWKFTSALPFDMEEDELANPIRLKRYWSRWRSRARVPLDKLHLGNSPDRSRTLTIEPRDSIGSSLSFAALEYSERRADVGMAGSEIREQTENMMLWEIWDKDLDWDGQSPPDPSWSLRLTRPPGLGRHLSSDLILLTIAAISTAAAIYALFHHVYLSF